MQAIAFARAGASLILTARRQAQLEEVKKAALAAHKEGATGKGGIITCLTLDMQDRAAIKGLLDRIPDELKNVDVLVNNVRVFRSFECRFAKRHRITLFRNVNLTDRLHLAIQAGLVYGKEHVGEIDEDEIDIMFQTNVLGLITLTQLFVRGVSSVNLRLLC